MAKASRAGPTVGRRQVEPDSKGPQRRQRKSRSRSTPGGSEERHIGRAERPRRGTTTRADVPYRGETSHLQPLSRAPSHRCPKGLVCPFHASTKSLRSSLGMDIALLWSNSKMNKWRTAPGGRDKSGPPGCAGGAIEIGAAFLCALWDWGVCGCWSTSDIAHDRSFIGVLSPPFGWLLKEGMKGSEGWCWGLCGAVPGSLQEDRPSCAEAEVRYGVREKRPAGVDCVAVPISYAVGFLQVPSQRIRYFLGRPP